MHVALITIVTVPGFLTLGLSTVYLMPCMGIKYTAEHELASNKRSCPLQANASACIPYSRSQEHFNVLSSGQMQSTQWSGKLYWVPVTSVSPNVHKHGCLSLTIDLMNWAPLITFPQVKNFNCAMVGISYTWKSLRWIYKQLCSEYIWKRIATEQLFGLLGNRNKFPCKFCCYSIISYRFRCSFSGC